MYPRHLESRRHAVGTQPAITEEESTCTSVFFSKSWRRGLWPGLPARWEAFLRFPPPTLTPHGLQLTCTRLASKTMRRALPGALSVPAPRPDRWWEGGRCCRESRSPEDQRWVGKGFASPERSTPAGAGYCGSSCYLCGLQKRPRSRASMNINHRAISAPAGSQ